MYCRSCNYNLKGCKSQKCPECGLVFDPSSDHTYLSRPAPSQSGLWVRRVLALVAGPATGLIVLTLLIEIHLQTIGFWLDAWPRSMFFSGPERQWTGTPGMSYRLDDRREWAIQGNWAFLAFVQFIIVVTISLVSGIIARRRIKKWLIPENHKYL